MLTVGVLARVEVSERARLKQELLREPCVQVLELEEKDCLGLVIQAPDVDTAHAWLREELQSIPGVLCAWPVHTELGPRSA